MSPSEKLADYRRVVFFTGAGMSAESGVPTYRGAGGIWKEYDWQQYACQAAFAEDPARVWDFHNYRRTLVQACAPNRGHEVIAELERAGRDVRVVTQNIDGLHQRAGSRQVIELHGSLWRVRCGACRTVAERREAPLADPTCGGCGDYLRPDIVWFGDALSPAVLNDAVAAISRADLLVSIGTSGVVHPAAALPAIARKHGATLVEINTEETAISELFHLHLRGTATEMLARMAAGQA